MNTKESRLARLAGGLKDDSGIALATVVMVAAIMFILVTAVLTLVAYRETQTGAYTARTKAMHLADAGTNEYLYQLSQDYGYWKTATTLGPTQMQDGSWRVTATAPTGADPLRLSSVGTLKDGTHRTISATVVFPTFADYVFVIDKSDLTIGSAAVIDGKVWCNMSIVNDGVITGLATAVNACSPVPSTTHYPGDYRDKNHYTGKAPVALDFSQLTTDLNKQKQAANDAGTYYAASGTGFLGYEVIFSGPKADVYKISAINYKVPYTGQSTAVLGARTKTLVGSVVIPASGVMYFDDMVWVSGDYSANVTLASSKDIYMAGNFVPTSPTSNITAGIVTSGYIYFPYWCDSVPATHKVQCALLSQGAKIGTQWTGTAAGNADTLKYDSGLKKWVSTTISPAVKVLDFDGSFGMVTQQGFVMGEGQSTSQGYASRSYSGDDRLTKNPPPLYPQIPGGDLRVNTWLEH